MSDFNLINLNIDGKPLEKFIDVVSKGIGALHEPYGIKRIAKARAYEIDVISKAKIKAKAEEKESEIETLHRIEDRIIHRELKKQQNIEATLNIAAEQISQEESVSEEPVNDDWITRYFNIIEDVSDEEMQKLWGRILAGEVKKPKSYSLRTLEIVKSLSRKEAEIFNKVAQYVIETTGHCYFLPQDKNTELYITDEDCFVLNDIGFLNPNSFINFSIDPNRTYWYKIENKVVLLKTGTNFKTKSFYINLLTNPAVELLNLIDPKPSTSYLTSFASLLKEDDSKILIADFIRFDNNMLHYKNEKIIHESTAQA